MATRQNLKDLAATTRQNLKDLAATTKTDLLALENRLSDRMTRLEGRMSLLHWLVGTVGFGVLLLLVRAFWPAG
ncbi:MAG: hypothetical protein M3Z21_16505 [Pseudomonadota bacterium]|nr:hypothetical protein [Pseudomonadota bacterium]